MHSIKAGRIMRLVVFLSLLLAFVVNVAGFTARVNSPYLDKPRPILESRTRISSVSTVLLARLSDKRKKELGVSDDEDEYDLSQALNANTDPLITKLIAGSLIAVVLGLLIVAVIIPLTSDPGEGLCSPILNAGRC
jgi:hypothetical protein